ncbi:DUF6221 family protein [Streptomyces sp. NPDC002131]|uniref:DUF6221 family protein n=1 Tax=Streptomyces sp. NPDC002131 TaxID=3154535 RepID=UPI00332AE177
MDELVQWLGGMLDEDEQIAQLASSGPWNRQVGQITGGPDGRVIITQQAQAWNADHIAAHDPARVLREVEAKRDALAHFERIRQHTRQGDEAYVLAEGAVSKQIQIMATAYADRPGYREDWRP